MKRKPHLMLQVIVIESKIEKNFIENLAEKIKINISKNKSNTKFLLV
jgi:hypothetical protein